MNIKVLKIGGSMISKSNDSLVDTEYLLSLKSLIMDNYAKFGTRFMLVAGGGRTARRYRDILETCGITNKQNLHWVGTSVNVVHAMIIKAVFDTVCDEDVLKFEEYYQDLPLKIENVVKAGGGGRPGHSGDVDTIIVAKRLGCNIIYSLKDVDGIYDSDPDKNPNAKRVNNLTWDEYLDIIGNPVEHAPGANFPIDPIAAKMAKEEDIKFIVLAGKDLPNFEKALRGEEFIGSTVI